MTLSRKVGGNFLLYSLYLLSWSKIETPLQSRNFGNIMRVSRERNSRENSSFKKLYLTTWENFITQARNTYFFDLRGAIKYVFLAFVVRNILFYYFLFSLSKSTRIINRPAKLKMYFNFRVTVNAWDNLNAFFFNIAFAVARNR